MELSADAIWLATAAVDMRSGIDGLSLHVQQALGRPPCDGTAYVFANRRRTRLKLVCWVRISRLSRTIVTVNDRDSSGTETQALIPSNRVDIPHVLHGKQFDVCRDLNRSRDLIRSEGLWFAVIGVENAIRRFK